MAEERIKVKLPRPRDYGREEALETAKKIHAFANRKVDDLEIDEQELKWFSDFVIYKIYKEIDKVSEIDREEGDKQFFEHDRFID